uniref:Uncharacterized protein n=1 Tax=Rhizophora mucronata TaxID=61149 RepID=A0A2P2MQV1_RHIMU
MVASFGLPPWPLVLPTATTGVVRLGIGRASSNPTAAATALHLSGLIAPAPQSQHRHPLSHASSSYASDCKFCAFGLLRREALFSSLGLLSGALSIASTDNTIIAMASEFADSN